MYSNWAFSRLFHSHLVQLLNLQGSEQTYDPTKCIKEHYSIVIDIKIAMVRQSIILFLIFLNFVHYFWPCSVSKHHWLCQIWTFVLQEIPAVPCKKRWYYKKWLWSVLISSKHEWCKIRQYLHVYIYICMGNSGKCKSCTRGVPKNLHMVTSTSGHNTPLVIAIDIEHIMGPPSLGHGLCKIQLARVLCIREICYTYLYIARVLASIGSRPHPPVQRTHWPPRETIER